MKPQTCCFYNGNLYKSRTDFIAIVKNEVVSIQNVPAYICEHCGEAFFEPEVSRKTDKIMEAFHAGDFLAHPIAAGEIEFDLTSS